MAIFCVLIGYFTSAKRNIGFATYIIKRYLQFAINIFMVLVLFTIANAVVVGTQFAEIGRGIMIASKESALLEMESILHYGVCVTYFLEV